MKILLVSYHNPNFVNTTHYREKAIEYLGHELMTFDDRSFLIPGSIRERMKFLQQWDINRINKNLVERTRRDHPEICFVVGGQRILPETVEKIKKQGIKIVLWTTDAPIDFTNILAAAPFYDGLFCAGTEAVDIFKDSGLSHAAWIPFACDPFYHKPVSLTADDQKQYGHDVIFVGSHYPNRARLLESVSDFNLAVWGPYWNKLNEGSPLRGKSIDLKINYDRWVKMYSAAKIVLVIHYHNSNVPCHQASPKLFEAMACGSFVLVDDQKDARALFQDKKHVVFFKSEQDLREKIRYYLHNETERRAIAQEGQREVLKNHTYQNRFQQMLSKIRM